MDKKILSDWIKLQAAYEGSERELNRKIGVSQEHIRYWRDQKVDWLKKDSIEKIAKYRNETPLQTRAWVTGKTVSEYVAGELKGLPKHLLVGVFEKIHEMLSTADDFNGKVNPVPLKFDEKMCSPVGREIVYELKQSINRGEFENPADALDRFLDMCSFGYPEEQAAIVRGLIRGSVLMVGNAEIALIADALRELSGNSKYTANYLRQIQKSTPAPVQEQGCPISL